LPAALPRYAPAARVALGDDVGVALERERAPRPAAALDDRDDVRPARRHLGDQRLPTERPHGLGHQLRGGGLPRSVLVHRAQPHQVAGQRDHGLLVDGVGHTSSSGTPRARSAAVRPASAPRIVGTAATSRRVYGCSGASATRAAGPSSTSSPWCSTAIVSQTWRTTARSCETNTSVSR